MRTNNYCSSPKPLNPLHQNRNICGSSTVLVSIQRGCHIGARPDPEIPRRARAFRAIIQKNTKKKKLAERAQIMASKCVNLQKIFFHRPIGSPPLEASLLPACLRAHFPLTYVVNLIYIGILSVSEANINENQNQSFVMLTSTKV